MTSSQRLDRLANTLEETFAELGGVRLTSAFGELALEIPRDAVLEVMQQLHDGDTFQFEACIDICGVDLVCVQAV